MARHIDRRHPEVEDVAFDMILEGRSFDDIANAMGLGKKTALARYQIQYPDFSEAVIRAQLARCQFLMEDALNVNEAYHNHNKAKVQLEAIAKVLAWINPAKFSPKQNIAIEVNVNIADALDRAERRVLESSKSNVIPLIASSDDSPDRV